MYYMCIEYGKKNAVAADFRLRPSHPSPPCRCWACCAPVSCCAGEVTTQRMSCWSPPTATPEGSSLEPVPRAESCEKSKGASPDISTVDSRCSRNTSSSTPRTIHNIVANTDDVVWVGAGFEGKNSIYWHAFWLSVTFCSSGNYWSFAESKVVSG